jgi:hypothetical protein
VDHPVSGTKWLLVLLAASKPKHKSWIDDEGTHHLSELKTCKLDEFTVYSLLILHIPEQTGPSPFLSRLQPYA